MPTLTLKQKNLLRLVNNHNGSCTHYLANIRGDRQTYESNLRDRLKILEKQFLIKSVEIKKPGQDHVCKRLWNITLTGKLYLAFGIELVVLSESIDRLDVQARADMDPRKIGFHKKLKKFNKLTGLDWKIDHGAWEVSSLGIIYNNLKAI